MKYLGGRGLLGGVAGFVIGSSIGLPILGTIGGIATAKNPQPVKDAIVSSYHGIIDTVEDTSKTLEKARAYEKIDPSAKWTVGAGQLRSPYMILSRANTNANRYDELLQTARKNTERTGNLVTPKDVYQSRTDLQRERGRRKRTEARQQGFTDRTARLNAQRIAMNLDPSRITLDKVTNYNRGVKSAIERGIRLGIYDINQYAPPMKILETEFNPTSQDEAERILNAAVEEVKSTPQNQLNQAKTFFNNKVRNYNAKFDLGWRPWGQYS